MRMIFSVFAWSSPPRVIIDSVNWSNWWLKFGFRNKLWQTFASLWSLAATALTNTFFCAGLTVLFSHNSEKLLQNPQKKRHFVAYNML
jgi:hypothetical protein